MKPIKKVILTEAVVSEIIDYISSNKLEVGDKLPAERTLADSLGISRAIVREALIILEVNNIVEKKHGVGIFIKNLDSFYLSKYQKDPSQNELYKILRELGEVRLMIEVHSMIEASKRITSTQIKQLYEHEAKEHEALLTLQETDDNQIIVNLDFEMMFTEISGNSYILELHRSLNERWKKSFEMLEANVFPVSVRHRDHLKIIDAVSSGDEEAIRKEARNHVSKVIHSFEQLITE